MQDWKPTSTLGRFGLFGAASSLSHLLGLERLGALADRAGDEMQAATLDGLVSLWHAGP